MDQEPGVRFADTWGDQFLLVLLPPLWILEALLTKADMLGLALHFNNLSKIVLYQSPAIWYQGTGIATPECVDIRIYDSCDHQCGRDDHGDHSGHRGCIGGGPIGPALVEQRTDNRFIQAFKAGADGLGCVDRASNRGIRNVSGVPGPDGGKSDIVKGDEK